MEYKEEKESKKNGSRKEVSEIGINAGLKLIVEKADIIGKQMNEQKNNNINVSQLSR